MAENRVPAVASEVRVGEVWPVSAVGRHFPNARVSHPARPLAAAVRACFLGCSCLLFVCLCGVRGRLHYVGDPTRTCTGAFLNTPVARKPIPTLRRSDCSGIRKASVRLPRFSRRVPQTQPSRHRWRFSFSPGGGIRKKKIGFRHSLSRIRSHHISF